MESKSFGQIYGITIRRTNSVKLRVSISRTQKYNEYIPDLYKTSFNIIKCNKSFRKVKEL